MDYYDFKSHADLGSSRGEGSNTWGWVSDDGREFVAIGQVGPLSIALDRITSIANQKIRVGGRHCIR
jgi:hypothetical protein